MPAGWVVCGRASVCRREDGRWFACRPTTGEMVGGRGGPSLSPPSPSRACFNIRALAMAVFMQAPSCFFSSPLVPSCPPSLPGARAALRLSANHGPGIEQNRARGLDRAREPEFLASKKK